MSAPVSYSADETDSFTQRNTSRFPRGGQAAADALGERHCGYWPTQHCRRNVRRWIDWQNPSQGQCYARTFNYGVFFTPYHAPAAAGLLTTQGPPVFTPAWSTLGTSNTHRETMPSSLQKRRRKSQAIQTAKLMRKTSLSSFKSGTTKDIRCTLLYPALMSGLCERKSLQAHCAPWRTCGKRAKCRCVTGMDLLFIQTCLSGMLYSVFMWLPR